MTPPLGGIGAGDPVAPTNNVRKSRRQAPWEAVLVLEVQDPQGVL
jgi:hypothetical protein